MQLIDKSVYNFSPENKPVAKVKANELLLFKTMDCFSNQITKEEELVLNVDYNTCNPAAGPVFIEGAQPGDILVVDILDIQVANQGVICTFPGIGPLCDDMADRTKVIKIENGIASFNEIKFPIKPMIGVIGTAPASGSIIDGYPGSHGGNMDNKLINKGTRLYFPVRVEGALLQMGDIHATMGDGEICGTGIEVPGEIMVNTSIIKGCELNWPVLETEDKWYVIASADEYPEALKNACKETQRLLTLAYGWDKTDAYLYMSVQVDIEICQACKPCEVPLIVRAGIPKCAYKKPLIK